MKIKNILFSMAGLCALSIQAQNPIIQTHYTADPAPMVYNDTLYLYVGCGHNAFPVMGSSIGISLHRTHKVPVLPLA